MGDQDAHLLEICIARFRGLKLLADKALAQVEDEQLHEVPAPDTNSIAVIMKHMAGNMRSRWTDFLTSDGEKPWRKRDREFEETGRSREEVEADWESGWACLFSALEGLGPEDLGRQVTIRTEPHSVIEALLRQLSHYGYHVGQIVYVAHMLRGEGWETLSVARGASEGFNRSMGHNV